MSNLPQIRTSIATFEVKEGITECRVHGRIYNEEDFSVLQAAGLVKRSKDSQEVTNIKKVPKLDAKKSISMALIKATEILRHKDLPVNESLQMAEDIYLQCCRSYPSLKFEEILIAINFGSYGKYDSDVVYLSASKVIIWIKRYLMQKYTITDGYLKAKEKERVKTSENESKQKEKDYMNRFHEVVVKEFNHYKEHGELSESVHLLIKGFEKIGYKSEGKGFLGGVIDVDLKKVWKSEIQKRVVYEAGMYSVDRNDPENVKSVFDQKPNEAQVKLIIYKCKVKGLEYCFDIWDEIDTEEIKQLTKEL